MFIGVSALPGPSSSFGSQPLSLQKKLQPSVNVKVVQAAYKQLSNGRPEFTPQNQTFIEVCESTANVHYVNSAVQRKWGTDYTMVTSDGLKIDDSAGTQGVFFFRFFIIRNIL